MNAGLLLFLSVRCVLLVRYTELCHQCESQRFFSVQYRRRSSVDRWLWLVEKYDRLTMMCCLNCALFIGLWIRIVLEA